MKIFFNIFIISFFINISLLKIITCQYILNHCNNGTREIILKNEPFSSLPCIECPEGEFTYYNEKTKSFYCEKCPEGSSNYKNDIIINNFLKDDLLAKYSYESFCSIGNNLCPKWAKNYFSIKVNYTESLSYKSYFTLKQYFMKDGELIIKYINFNGDIDKSFNIYINGKLSFTDDTNNNILNTKFIKVKKGENIFNFEYLVNQEIKQKGEIEKAFLEIFEIIFKNAEISALNCEKYDLIKELNNNLLNSCEYDVSKCDVNNDYCTYRFYSEIKKDFCIKQMDSFYQEIEYKKIQNANCMEISDPPNQNILCEFCSYGQYNNYLDDLNKECKYCENNNYNSKEINDENSCSEICEKENKELIKILYINNFDNPSNINIEKIEIIQPIGYIIVNYEKFNEKTNTIFYIEIDSNHTIKLIEPNYNKMNYNSELYSFDIPLVYGKHSLIIKGSNLQLNKIIIKGSSEGGNYKCVEKIYVNKETKCKNDDEYYSLLQNKCLKCPLGTFIDKNRKCEMYSQFINKIYTLDNNDININIFSKNFELDDIDYKYYLKINPTNPLIYMKNKSNINEKAQIIGKELKSIKIVKGIDERGIILSFISRKDNTYIYIKCIPYYSKFEKPEISLKNKIQEKDITSYFFEIKSITACPYCLTSEVIFESSGSKCVNGMKKANTTIKNNTLCVIKSFYEEKLKLKDDINILLNKSTTNLEEVRILTYFGISEQIPINFEEENDKIITDNENEILCEDKDKLKLYIALMILFFFVVLVILGFIGVAIWKIIDINIYDDRAIIENNSNKKVT